MWILIGRNFDVVQLLHYICRMFKKITIAALLAAVALTEGHMVGGYKKKEQAEVANFQTNIVLASAIEAARNEFRSKNNGELGNVIEVYEQVVAGMNYKMIFQTQNGNYEVVVWAQPWNDKYQVTSMNPVVNNQ